MFTIYGYDEHIHKCVPCINAKRLLATKKKEFEFISVVIGKDENGPVFDDGVILTLLDRLNRDSKVGLTMPQIFEDEVYIGGFTELREYLK